MIRQAIALWLAAALPAAAATEFLLTGKDLAGRAVVSNAGPNKVAIQASLRTFGKTSAAKAEGWAGVGAEAHFGSVTVKPGLVVALRPDGKGGYVSNLEGREVAWTRMKAPAASYGVLGVQGLTTALWNRAGIPYFEENLAALRAMGFAARRIPTDTQGALAKNTAIIAAEIRREAQGGRRVIVLAHSKGGAEVTSAIALEPALEKLVAGVVLLQPVYSGSPAAQLVEKHRLLEKAVQEVFEHVFHGKKEAVTDLSLSERAKFVAAHPYPASRVPTVVVRSTFQRRFSKSVLWVNEKLIRREYKKPNDGMVTREQAAVPGAARTIDLDDLDHFEPALRNESKTTPADVTTRGIVALMPLVR